MVYVFKPFLNTKLKLIQILQYLYWKIYVGTSVEEFNDNSTFVKTIGC